MGKSQNDSDITPVPPNKSTVILLLMTMADTTWRMFLPIIGLTIIGLLADKWLHSTPWIMIIAMAIGIALAALLVRQQLQRVKKK